MPIETSPNIKRIYGIKEPEDVEAKRFQHSPIEPIVLMIECETSQGLYRLRITQAAASGLKAALDMHRLTRGSP